MALRKRRYIPDRLGDGLTIENSNKKLIGIKTTEKEILILNESGFVVGVSNPKDGKKWKGIHVGNFNDRPKGEIL